MARHQKNNGYTLVELVIGMALIAIIFSIMVSIMVNVFDVMQTNRMPKQLLLDGFSSADKFTREYEKLESTIDIAEAGRYKIRFTADIESVVQLIEYELAGNRLWRSINGGTQRVICENVTGEWHYYDNVHGELSHPIGGGSFGSIWRVRMELNTFDNNGLVYTFMADAFPENLKF